MKDNQPIIEGHDAPLVAIDDLLAENVLTDATLGLGTAVSLAIPTAGLSVLAYGPHSGGAMVPVKGAIAHVGEVKGSDGSKVSVAFDAESSSYDEGVTVEGSSIYVSGILSDMSQVVGGSTALTVPVLTGQYDSFSIRSFSFDFEEYGGVVTHGGAVLDSVFVSAGVKPVTVSVGSNLPELSSVSIDQGGTGRVTIYDTGSQVAYDNHASGTTLHLSAASSVTIALGDTDFTGRGASAHTGDVTITGWISGRDSLSFLEVTPLSLISGATLLAAIGSGPLPSLDTLDGRACIIDLGNIGIGSAATVARAASQAYVGAQTPVIVGNSQILPDAYGLYFAGTTSAGNTEVFSFHGSTGAHGAIVPADLLLIATLIGVQTLTSGDLV